MWKWERRRQRVPPSNERRRRNREDPSRAGDDLPSEPDDAWEKELVVESVESEPRKRAPSDPDSEAGAMDVGGEWLRGEGGGHEEMMGCREGRRGEEEEDSC